MQAPTTPFTPGESQGPCPRPGSTAPDQPKSRPSRPEEQKSPSYPAHDPSWTVPLNGTRALHYLFIPKKCFFFFFPVVAWREVSVVEEVSGPGGSRVRLD